MDHIHGISSILHDDHNNIMVLRKSLCLSCMPESFPCQVILSYSS